MLKEDFYIQGSIYEYDIEHASASALYVLRLIPEQEYHNLITMRKEARVVKWGLMVKENPSVYVSVKEYLDNILSTFIKDNNINENDVIEKVFDGIWVKNVKASKSFEHDKNIKITEKNWFTSMLVFDGFAFYYNSVTGDFLSRYTSKEMEEIMNDYIKTAMGLKESGDVEKLYIHCHSFLINNQGCVKYCRKIHDLLEI